MAAAMEEVYEVKETEGKGLGCFALRDIKKGTLILREAPKIKLKYPDKINFSFARELSDDFEKMSENDQKEYMTLHDKFTNISILPPELKSKLEGKFNLISELSKKDEKLGKILKIYLTNLNNFGTISFKAARLNHACRPNAFAIYGSGKHDSNYQILFIISIANIKTGEEITIAYRELRANAYKPLAVNSDPDFAMFEMRSKKKRQEIILKKDYFVCRCVLCQEDDKNDNSEELINEIENLDRKDLSLASDKRIVECCKELYRLGKAKNVRPLSLYSILSCGFLRAIGQLVWINDEELKIAAINFAKAADKFDKILGSQMATCLNGRANFWREKYENFEVWFQRYRQAVITGDPSKIMSAF